MNFIRQQSHTTNMVPRPIAPSGLRSPVSDLHSTFPVRRFSANGEKEILKEIREMEKVEERLEVFQVDVLDYHSILDAIKGCSGLFCSFDSTEGYDDAGLELEVRGVINVMEVCTQTFGIHRVVFSPSITAAIWRENITSDTDHIDERSWSDPDFCRKMKVSMTHGVTLWVIVDNTCFRRNGNGVLQAV